jgi:hypothetical protein
MDKVNHHPPIEGLSLADAQKRGGRTDGQGGRMHTVSTVSIQKHTKPMLKTRRSIRLSVSTCARLAELKTALGINGTAVIELAVAELAAKQGVFIK